MSLNILRVTHFIILINKMSNNIMDQPIPEINTPILKPVKASKTPN